MRAAPLLLLASGLAATPARAADPAPPPYVLRVLALGHEPERRFFRRPDGFLDMHELDPRELPPAALFARPAAQGRESDRARLSVSLNSVTEAALPPPPASGDTLALERELRLPAEPGRPAEVRYERLGEVARPAGSGSSLVLLHNPVGRRTWDDVRPAVIDTSESRIPPGTVLVLNLCAEPVDAALGGRAGRLAGGQSALVPVAAAAAAPLSVRLELRRGGESVQLFDSAREMPASRRALLVVHPVPVARNARGADFSLLPLTPDPAPVAPPAR